MYDLNKLFSTIDLQGAGFGKGRVRNVLEDLEAMLGADGMNIANKDLPTLVERFRAHLKTSQANVKRKRDPSMPDTPEAEPATIRNKVWRLSKLLKLAAEQGLLTPNDLRFMTGMPIPPKPRHRGPELFRYHAYLAFEAWCSARRLPLDRIEAKTFATYRDSLKAEATEGNSSWPEIRYDYLVRYWTDQSSPGLLPKIVPPRWSDTSARRYGLNNAHWPSAAKNDFEAFVRAASDEARPGEKRRRAIREASINHIRRELVQYFGYLANVEEQDLENKGLRELLSDHDAVLAYVTWHIERRCSGSEHRYHRETLDWFARLLEWFEGDPKIASKYRTAAKSLRAPNIKTCQ